MSNPFEAAIQSLKDINSRGGGPNHSCPQCASRRAAIRVLEAAGKVDKEDKELAIHWMEDDYSTIRALLAAIPDGDKS